MVVGRPLEALGGVPDTDGPLGTGGAPGTGDVPDAGASLGTGGTPCTGSETTLSKYSGSDGGDSLGYYVVSCDGLTVTDSSTGLVWQRNGSGIRAGCTGNSDGHSGGNLTCTWPEAMTYCAQLYLDGSGWRLPTLTELQSILDKSITPATINLWAFPSTPAFAFWTSSEAGDNAWAVRFDNGNSVAAQSALLD